MAVTVAVPALTPFTVVVMFGLDVMPRRIVKLGGVTANVGGLLLFKVITTSEEAAAPSVTGKLTVSPTARLTFEGRLICGITRTVILAVALPKLDAVAVIVHDPVPTAVTGTAMLVAFAGTVTDPATVAADVLLDDKYTTNPFGGRVPVKLSVRVWELPVTMTSDAGESAIVPPGAADFTWT
jgi:hypothetical protein